METTDFCRVVSLRGGQSSKVLITLAWKFSFKSANLLI